MSSGWSVIAVRYGTLETTRGEAYYRYQSYGEPDGPQVLDYYFWIVRRGDETILVDTGFDPDVGRRRGRTCLIEPADAMATLGIGPETVSRVVLTHDVAQRDNLRVGRHDGVAAVIEALKGHPLFAHVTLTRSERSPIAEVVTDLLEDLPFA